MLEYYFCPRFTYFEYVLGVPQHEENRFKVNKGRETHERVRRINPNYLRKKLGVTKKLEEVYLSGPPGIRGIVDEILFFNNGFAAPLEYKYAEYKNKLFKTYQFQLVFYAMLIQHNFELPVDRGFIVYTRSNNKIIEIAINKKDYCSLDNDLQKLLNILHKCHYPKPTISKMRCLDCCYRNICEKKI